MIWILCLWLNLSCTIQTVWFWYLWLFNLFFSQCWEHVFRTVYEYMVTAQREKGRSKNNKVESISYQQLQTAQEDYDEEATLFVFRLKSLKQGQSRSLLTQAARHHAAQVFLVPLSLSLSTFVLLDSSFSGLKWVLICFFIVSFMKAVKFL